MRFIRRNFGTYSMKYLFAFVLFICVVGYMNNILMISINTEWTKERFYHGSLRLKRILSDKQHKYIKDTRKEAVLRDIKAFGMTYQDTAKIPKIPRVLIAPDSRTCDNGIDLLIYVQSNWANFMKRRYIRNTWGGKTTLSGHNIRTIFILGRPNNKNDQVKINNEHLLYGDLLEIDTTESFQNLSMKCVSALAWINKNCSTAEYILKVDDDIFVNLFKVFRKVLPLINSQSKLILCHVIEEGKSPIVRDKNSKWYIPLSVFPNRTHLPRFCSGYFAIMTKPVLHDLYLHSLTTPLITVDDVYLFGHLTQGIRDLYFVNVKDNLTLFQNIGLESYKSNEDSFIGVSVGDTNSMEELWSLTLNQVYKRIKSKSKHLRRPRVLRNKVELEPLTCEDVTSVLNEK